MKNRIKEHRTVRAGDLVPHDGLKCRALVS
jgi:hypothetical protein